MCQGSSQLGQHAQHQQKVSVRINAVGFCNLQQGSTQWRWILHHSHCYRTAISTGHGSNSHSDQSPQYYIACGYTDLRLGTDRLAAVVTQQYGSQLDEEILFCSAVDGQTESRLYIGRATDISYCNKRLFNRRSQRKVKSRESYRFLFFDLPYALSSTNGMLLGYCPGLSFV